MQMLADNLLPLNISNQSDEILITDNEVVILDDHNASASAPEEPYTNQPSGSSFIDGSSSSNQSILDTLMSLFFEKFTADQISTIYLYSGDDFDASVECLGSDGLSEAILKMINRQYSQHPLMKAYIDKDEIWCDLLSFYKSISLPCKRRLRVSLNGVPSIDTGGVRRQIYTTAFSEFAQNTHIHLFDGPPNHARPFYSAESRGSGIFKALGLMIGHSILQDGVGFNHFSPLSYWYLACGEEKALQYSCLDDIGQDTAEVISKVRNLQSCLLQCILYPYNNFCSCCVPKCLIWKSYSKVDMYLICSKGQISVYKSM